MDHPWGGTRILAQTRKEQKTPGKEQNTPDKTAETSFATKCNKIIRKSVKMPNTKVHKRGERPVQK